MSTTLTSVGLTLSLGGVPAGATLQCELDNEPLVPCTDGSIYATPAAGGHKITAVATINGNVVALGASAPFVVAN